jgi:hypothetical protein
MEGYLACLPIGVSGPKQEFQMAQLKLIFF